MYVCVCVCVCLCLRLCMHDVCVWFHACVCVCVCVRDCPCVPAHVRACTWVCVIEPVSAMPTCTYVRRPVSTVCVCVCGLNREHTSCLYFIFLKFHFISRASRRPHPGKRCHQSASLTRLLHCWGGGVLPPQLLPGGGCSAGERAAEHQRKLVFTLSVWPGATARTFPLLQSHTQIVFLASKPTDTKHCGNINKRKTDNHHHTTRWLLLFGLNVAWQTRNTGSSCNLRSAQWDQWKG